MELLGLYLYLSYGQFNLVISGFYNMDFVCDFF